MHASSDTSLEWSLLEQSIAALWHSSSTHTRMLQPSSWCVCLLAGPDRPTGAEAAILKLTDSLRLLETERDEAVGTGELLTWHIRCQGMLNHCGKQVAGSRAKR
jgi:hypothetical protein